nr:GerAB/ArcD/ProY family transporter [Ammoniphilus sp. YIM 78166]
MRQINIADFIQRLDALGGAVLFIGGFFKMTIFFNAAVSAVHSLFKNKRRHLSIVLLWVASIVFVNLFFENYTFYQEVGIEVNQYLLYPFQLLIPGFLLLLIIIKKKGQKSTKKEEGRP